MTTIKRHSELATSLQKLGVAPSALTTGSDAAKAALEAGTGALAKKTARALLELDAASLKALRALMGAAKEPAPSVVAGGGGAGVRRDDVESKLPRAPDAERALAIYRPKQKSAERPFERFLVHAARLHDELSGPNGKLMLTDPKVAEGVRKQLFMLEGLARFYEERGPSKKMEKALDRIKELEDTIGAFGYASDMRSSAKDLQGLPAGTPERLDRAVAKAQKDLAAVLEDGWLPSSGRSERLNDLVDTFAKIDFGSEKKDRAFVKEQLARTCDELAHADLDMNDLEGGVHELRRQLRWLPITMIALDGLVSLDEKTDGPIAAFAKLKSEPVAQSPFARLPTSSVPNADKQPIEIPWTLFLALSQAIGDLGKIKDAGQAIEGLALTLEDAVPKKDAHHEAERLLGNVGGLARVHADATRIATDLTNSGLLEALAAAFKDA